VTLRQLPLPIPSDPAYDEASFLPAASNEAARIWLSRTELWPDQRLVLWGGADRGKTHLLRIWAGHTGAALLDGPGLPDFPEIVSPFGAAVDNADRAGEAGLLHLLNTAHDLGRPILLAGRAPPARWTVVLRDLDSRLRAITAVEIGSPDDELLRRLLLHWLKDRRLVANEALHEQLLMRLPRSPEALHAAVMRLDRDALTSRRRTVTPAMLRAALLSEPSGAESVRSSMAEAGRGPEKNPSNPAN
jgi:chromosomal replication initiation ATPase DnaA